jgi:hypothetical protein
MTQPTKYIIESFDQFLSEIGTLSEAEESANAIFGTTESGDLIQKIMDYNVELGSDNLEKNSNESIIGDLKRSAAKYLREGEYWKAAACNIFWKQWGENWKKDLPIYKALDLKHDDLVSSKSPTKTKFKDFQKALDAASDKNLKDSVVNSLKEAPDSLSIQTKYPILWQLVPDTDKQKIYADFEQLARRKGYDGVEGIEKIIESHFKRQKKEGRSNLINPAIQVFLDKSQVKSEDTVMPTSSKTTAVIPVENAHETFKPNMWGQNGEDDYVQGNFDEMVKNIGLIFERRKTGEIQKIRSITVMTSCDRRRNTGPAEKMSWGQLALARATSMANLVVEMSKKVELQPDEIETINKMIRLDFMGQNGDGSSGPNPDINPGYYVKSDKESKWVGVKDPKEIVMIPASDTGLPSLASVSGAKTKTKEPISADDKKAFNNFRYNNIVFEIEVVTVPKGSTTPIPSSEQIKDLIYPVKMIIPSRYKSKSLSISLPSIKIGSIAGSPGKRPSLSCPNFKKGGGKSIGFGIELKPITIASWKSDLTKD